MKGNSRRISVSLISKIPRPRRPRRPPPSPVRPAPFRHSLDRGRTHLKIPITVARSRREGCGRREENENFLRRRLSDLGASLIRGKKKKESRVRPLASRDATKGRRGRETFEIRLIRAAVPRVSRNVLRPRTRVTGRRLKDTAGPPPRSLGYGGELLSRAAIHFSRPRQCRRTARMHVAAA